MNGWSNYDDEDGEVYDQLIREGRNGERKALAATLTRLRKTLINGNEGYLSALDAVAEAHGLKTETIVRYTT